MAYRIRAKIDFDWVPDGAGGAILGQQQGDNPGYGYTGAGPVGAAQTLSMIDAEIVPGGDSPNQANFNTALSNMIATIETQMGTPGAAFGSTQTPLALIQGWSTGNP